MTGRSHRRRHGVLRCVVPLLALGALLAGCSARQSDPSTTEDANPASFRPLYDKTLAALDEPTGAQPAALQKLFPNEAAPKLANVVGLCGTIDPGTQKLHLLESLDPYHIMTGHLTGRERDSSAHTNCGLALMWTTPSRPGVGGWEIQAWSLDASSTPTPVL